VEDFEILKEVQGIVGDLNPQWLNCNDEDIEGHGCFRGQGYVGQSMFFVGHHCAFWIVILCETGRFAFKELPSESLEAFAPLILDAKRIFVKFTRHYRITEFIAIQEKECPC